jgi:hypothetical protein
VGSSPTVRTPVGAAVLLSACRSVELSTIAASFRAGCSGFLPDAPGQFGMYRDDRMTQHEKEGRLDFRMSAATTKRLAELQDSVRKFGHSRPSPRTLVSALIHAEQRRGKQLEEELLVPFRRANADAD